MVSDGLEQINEHDATANTGSEGFGDQAVTVEPASGVGGSDAEHPDGLGDGEQGADQATTGTIDVAVEVHVAHAGTGRPE